MSVLLAFSFLIILLYFYLHSAPTEYSLPFILPSEGSSDVSSPLSVVVSRSAPDPPPICHTSKVQHSMRIAVSAESGDKGRSVRLPYWRSEIVHWALRCCLGCRSSALLTTDLFSRVARRLSIHYISRSDGLEFCGIYPEEGMLAEAHFV